MSVKIRLQRHGKKGKPFYWIVAADARAITTGDNYVGSSEPQLREKMSELYSKIASTYDKPSNSELEYLSIIEDRFNNSKKLYAKILKKAKFKKDMKFKTFEEFVK